jgi:hypothetical protein
MADCLVATSRPPGSEVIEVVRPISTGEVDLVAEIGAIFPILRLLI